ncbi:MAG: hypothetical protein M1819_004403 [Sarea resinae]|nr:MAG: hypothetical protein M1819_004403 [Sarea resinae]
MPLSCAPALPQDMPGLIKAQYSAFYPMEPLHDIIYPGPPTPANLATALWRQLSSMAAEGGATFLKVTDDDTGALVAGAKWFVYEDEAKRHEGHVNVDWVGEEGSKERAWAQEVMDQFVGRRARRMKGKHALLDLCFCAPTHQARGAGSLLVSWGCRTADSLNIPAFVEASMPGQRLYEKHGFVATEDVKLSPARVGGGEDRFGPQPELRYLFMERGVQGKKEGLGGWREAEGGRRWVPGETDVVEK